MNRRHHRLLACIVAIAAAVVSPRTTAAAAPDQLVVFTQPGRSALARDFEANHLPSIRALAGELGADPWGNDRLGIAATLKVSRRDFGIMFDRKMADGSPLIGDDVKIRLSVEAAKM